MGLSPRSLSAEVLAAAGYTKGANGRARPKLRPSLEGYAWWWLPGDPPTCTHHAKKIVAGHLLLNDPKLKAAWEWYLLRVPERSELIPLRPPYCLRAEFRWALPLDVHRWPDDATYGGFHQEKPDLDNSKKVLADVLELRGWLVDDSMVAKDSGSEKRWCQPGQRPGVMVYVRTLAGPNDSGAPIYPAPGEPQNQIHPAPWIEQRDYAAFLPGGRGCPRTPRRRSGPGLNPT
jgi:hypothetical protein